MTKTVIAPQATRVPTKRRDWDEGLEKLSENHINAKKNNLINEVYTDTCTFLQGGGEWLHHNAVMVVNELNVGCSHTLPLLSIYVYLYRLKKCQVCCEKIIPTSTIEYHETERIWGVWFFFSVVGKKRVDTCRSRRRLMRNLKVKAEYSSPE